MKARAMLVDASIVEALRARRAVAFHAMGGSMGAALPSGARVRVSPCDARTVRMGDVVAIERPDGGVALHRAVNRTKDGALVTWGDALARPDAWTSREVLGRVTVLDAPRERSARALRSRIAASLRWRMRVVVALAARAALVLA